MDIEPKRLPIQFHATIPGLARTPGLRVRFLHSHAWSWRGLREAPIPNCRAAQLRAARREKIGTSRSLTATKGIGVRDDRVVEARRWRRRSAVVDTRAATACLRQACCALTAAAPEIEEQVWGLHIWEET